MVQLCNHNLVPRPPVPAQCARNMKRQGCHIIPKDYFLGRAIEEISKSPASPRDHLISFLTSRKLPARIGVVAEKVLAHRIHDLSRYLSSSRTIEVGHGLAGM